VEDHVCLTGGADGNVRLWDLRKVEEDEAWGEGGMFNLSDVAEGDEEDEEEGGHPNGFRTSEDKHVPKEGSCSRLLEGHTQAVTALYFEDECLVRGPRITYLLVLKIHSVGDWSI